MPIYRYQFKGVSIEEINTLLPNHSAELQNFSPDIFIDISAEEEDKEDLDEAMASKGCDYVATL